MNNVRFISRPIVVAIAAATLIVAESGTTLAANSCTTTQIKTSSYTLTADWETTNDSSACFDMRNGADLNLNGHSITCIDAACGPAVTCVSASGGNSIHSSVSNDPAHIDISGPFATGVQECSDVHDLAIDGAATAISSTAADSIDSNVLTNCSTACIVATMTASGDRIHDNLIDPNGGNGINFVGRSIATGPQIDHNLIRRFAVGISNSDSTYMRIQNNIFVEGTGTNDPIGVSSANASYTNNLCATDAKCTNEYDGILPPVGNTLN